MIVIFYSKDSDPSTPAMPFDWKMAQEEVLAADTSNEPIQSAIAKLEKQYEEDKQTALEKQVLIIKLVFNHSSFHSIFNLSTASRI